MTYSDDYPPFTGDQTGQLLAEPDMVALSPVTSARVVETQSGYLVVLKKADERLSLSVKRRIGTPPSSQVLLTPDESIQLSRVLADSVETLSEVRGDYLVKELRERTATQPAPSPADNELSTIYGDSAKTDEGGLDWDEIKQPWRKRKAKQTQQELGIDNLIEKPDKPVRDLPIKAIAISAAVVVAAAAGIYGVINWVGSMSSAPAKTTVSASAAAAAADQMAPENVDKFVRNFVANMLDFNPRTYRSSQVHAMASMKPKLLERYWLETSFPLPKSKLKAQHKDQTLIINKVLQQPTSSVTTDVELSADLSTPGQSETTPVRLQIDLALDQDGSLTVTDIKDSSDKLDKVERETKSENAESAPSADSSTDELNPDQ